MTPLANLDPILGPVLAARAEWPVTPAALAVACRGLDASVSATPNAIRLWLRSRGGQRFDHITSSPRVFHHRVSSRARARIASASSFPARRREAVQVSRRLIGIVSTESPTSVTETGKRIVWSVDGRRIPAPRLVDARHALAVVGLALIGSILDEGRDTVLVPGSWLAVRMGVGEPKARAALRTCVDLGWLRLVSKRSGSSGRYDLGTRQAKWLSPEARAFAYDHPFAVDALVERQPQDDPLAEVIACASHAAVSHDLKTKAWLAGLSIETGTPLTHLGLARGVGPARTDWMTAIAPMFEQRPEASLLEALDAHAKVTGADVRARIAEAARREAAARRKAETEAHRVAKKALFDWLADLLERHPVPRAGDGTASAWARTVAAQVVDVNVPRTLRGVLANSLATRLTSQGHAAEKAMTAARRIAGLPAKESTTTNVEEAA